MKRFFVIATLLLSCWRPLFSQTQVWVKVASESTASSATLPAGATYRLGLPSCPSAGGGASWSASITVVGVTTLNPLSFWEGGFPIATDPCPGSVKELDVLETTAPQTVTVTNNSTSPATVTNVTLGTVSGTAPVVPTGPVPTSIPVPAGASYVVTITNQTVAGTQVMFNMSMDGASFVCLYTLDTTQATCTVP